MYHVDGKREGNINQQEIDKIFKTIIFLKEKGIKPEIDLGIVTPYRSQAYKMKNDLSQFVPAQHIGTVHTFQGGEFSIIIMSTVLCDTEQPTAFINSAPNILNVAISRAKYLLIIVCNTEILATAGGHLTTIYEHAVRSGLLLKK
jgi:superfamily I DNA and/or RNA helicase